MGETGISRMAGGDVQPAKASYAELTFIDVPSVCEAPR